MFDGDEIIDFHINDAYAAKYESRKRGEELSMLKEKYGDDVMESTRLRQLFVEGGHDADTFSGARGGYSDESSSDDEEEDEVGELVTPEVDAQILTTISKIRRKDPVVYDASKNFFSEQEMETARQAWEKKQTELKKEKPMYLKDYHRKRILEGDATADNSDDDVTSRRPMTHVEEQERLKQELKNAVNADKNASKEDGDEDFFTYRKKDDGLIAKEEDEYKKFLLQHMASERASGWEEWKQHNEGKEVDENETFLMNFVLNKGWIDKDSKSKAPTYEELVAEEEDEEEVERMEDFEQKHNFRFEEEGSTAITTHAREIGNSIRRKDDRRKEMRERLKLKKQDAKQQKTEELKRMKNLKKQEILDKLKKIHTMAGVAVPEHELEKADDPEVALKAMLGLTQADIEGDFDPDAYDERMNSVFNDNYYNQDDRNDVPLKPDFGDDIDISDIIDPTEKDDKVLARKTKNADQDFIMDADYMPGGQYYQGDEFEEGADAPYGDAAEPSTNKIDESLDKYLEEYYQLDYEDMIGDLPTRFKYTSVPKENFGLDAAEILLADDMQLNELISLKKLAPYRRYESVAKDMEKFKSSKKKRIREFRRNLIEQVEAELEGRAVAETAAAASTLASSSSKKKSKKHADGAVASLANATLLKEKQIKSTMSKWLERIKDKRAEGQTPADVEEHKKKVRKEKKRKRAEEHRQKQQQVAAATINGDTAGENVNKKPKVSADRLKTYGK